MTTGGQELAYCRTAVNAVIVAVLLLIALVLHGNKPTFVQNVIIESGSEAATQLLPVRHSSSQQEGDPEDRCKTVAKIILTPQPNNCTRWRRLHDQHVAQIQAADSGTGYDLIFYGDSLTEMWRGLRQGKPYAPRSELPDVFQRHFGEWRATALGCSGDAAGHLLWRLQHGELPQQWHPKVVVLLIGTNDLRDAKLVRDASPTARQTTSVADAIAAAAPGVVQRVQDVLGLLQQQLPNTAILLLALLPRHKANKSPPLQWPNMYTKGLDIVNAALADHAKQQQGVHLLDCGAPFFASQDRIDNELMPDALHPSTKGAEVLAQCIKGGIQKLMRAS